MKTLIIYYSFSGNNHHLANILHERLHCDIVEIKETSKRTNFSILLDLLFARSSKIQKNEIDLRRYDSLIFIAPIWAGKIATPLKTFLKQESENIRNYSFISLCSGVPEQKEKIKIALQKIVGKPPLAIEELWVNDLLSSSKKNKIKYTTPYRIKPDDFSLFNPKIDKFLRVAVESRAESPNYPRESMRTTDKNRSERPFH